MAKKRKSSGDAAAALVVAAVVAAVGLSAVYWPAPVKPAHEIRMDVGMTRGEIVLGDPDKFHPEAHGVLQYCIDNPRECDDSKPAYAGDEWRQQAMDVNTYVDTVMHWPKNINAYTSVHETDWQLHPDGFGIGVCVEHAIAKKHLLLAAGMPPGAMALAVLNADGDPRGISHMVLLVRFRDGVYVLDNMDRNVWPITAAGDGHYIWFMQQDWGHPQHWVRVGKDTKLPTVQAMLIPGFEGGE